MKEDGWQAKKKKKRDGMNEQDEDIDERGRISREASANLIMKKLKKK
jgi:hypothetical protein